MNTAEIITPLKIDMAGFTAGIDRAKAEARSFTASMGSAMASVRKTFMSPLTLGIGGLAGGIGVIAGVRSAVNELSASMNRIDDGAKLVDRLGITAESFGALRHQANLAGADMGTLTMALQQQQKALADAAAGAKNSPFEKLGLDAKKLIDLPAEKAMGAIADAIKGIENPTARAAAVMEIFGMRSGPQLQAMLMEGSAGMEAARKKMEEMGGAFTRLDMAQVEAANDAITTLRETVSVAFDRIAISLAPAIEDFVGWAQQAAIAASNWAGENLRLIATSESLGEALFHQTRMGGLFGDPTTDIGVAMEQLAKAKLAADSAGESLRTAVDVTAQVEAQRQLTAALNDQYRIAKQIQELESAAAAMPAPPPPGGGGMGLDAVAGFLGFQPLQPEIDMRAPAGLSEDFVGDIKKQLDEATKQLTTFQRQKLDAIKLPDFEGPKLNMPAITSDFENMKERAASMMEDVQKQIRQLDMNTSEKLFDDFRETQPAGAEPGGLFGDDLAKFKTVIDDLDFKKQSKEATDAVAQWVQGMKTPLELLQDKIEGLHADFGEGLINEATFDAGIDAAKRQMEELKEKKDEAIDMTPKLASFIRSGSQDAYKLQAEIAAQEQGRADAAGGKSSMAMTAKQEETNKLLARIEKALADRPVIEFHTREF